MTLHRFDLPYACFGVVVDDEGFVREAPPIARWMVGKTLALARGWAQRRGGCVEIVR